MKRKVGKKSKETKKLSLYTLRSNAVKYISFGMLISAASLQAYNWYEAYDRRKKMSNERKFKKPYPHFFWDNETAKEEFLKRYFRIEGFDINLKNHTKQDLSKIVVYIDPEMEPHVSDDEIEQINISCFSGFFIAYGDVDKKPKRFEKMNLHKKTLIYNTELDKKFKKLSNIQQATLINNIYILSLRLKFEKPCSKLENSEA